MTKLNENSIKVANRTNLSCLLIATARVRKAQNLRDGAFVNLGEAQRFYFAQKPPYVHQRYDSSQEKQTVQIPESDFIAMVRRIQEKYRNV